MPLIEAPFPTPSRQTVLDHVSEVLYGDGDHLADADRLLNNGVVDDVLTAPAGDDGIAVVSEFVSGDPDCLMTYAEAARVTTQIDAVVVEVD